MEVPRVTLPEAVNSALNSRPELAQLQVIREINRINSEFYRDQTKPQVNLVASYTAQGLAGVSTLSGTSVFNNSAWTERVRQLSALAGLEPLPTTTPTGTTSTLNGGVFNSLGGLLSQKYLTYRGGGQI